MENVAFSMQDNSFKVNKLKKVILSKISDVSDNNIQTIIEAIDINKQHYVKATRNPRKFLNIVAEEDVSSDENFFKSQSQIIYGTCEPGIFIDKSGYRQSRQGHLDVQRPAAAVKSIISQYNDSTEKVEYLLVIYEPNEVAQ